MTTIGNSLSSHTGRMIPARPRGSGASVDESLDKANIYPSGSQTFFGLCPRHSSINHKQLLKINKKQQYFNRQYNICI